MDKSRQQFEDEFKKHTTLDKDDIFELDYDTDDYYYLETRHAWFWWQESRESLEVELPEFRSRGSDMYYDGFHSCLDDIREELISNGVKIKNE
ncbi:hypothetical protein ACUU3R_003983 [Providencia rettgeri]